jgi:hypothetical protein
MTARADAASNTSDVLTAVTDGLGAFEVPDIGSEEPDQPLSRAEQLIGGSRQTIEDDRANSAYFPPTDPVVIGQAIVCGFSPTSMDSVDVDSSDMDGQVGDEALADAVRQELHTDAATSGFDIDVVVEDRVAYLRGRVSGVEDVENVEEVASRLPQLSEVIEELDIASM